MATQYGGYTGKILQIDLTAETASDYPFTDHQRAETLGGKMLAYQILADQLTGKELALSPENLLILSTGPLTGTGVPGSARFEITSLSPKSGLPASSNCGGNFGIFLKKAGYDALILRGRCQSHRWIEISGNDVRFHSADALWRCGTSLCQKQLVPVSSLPFASLCIGPAGEDLLYSATVVSDGRAAGRTGLGAVLGWKQVKAITVSGNLPIRLHDPEETAAEILKWNHIIQESPLTADPEKVSSCPGCPIRCKRPGKTADSALNDLGIDSMDAENHLSWLKEKYGVTLANVSAHKSGQRRNKLYQSILLSRNLQNCDAVFADYQNLSEVISASGLCIFTIAVCLKDEWCSSTCFPLSERLSLLLQHSTGMHLQQETLLSLGRQNRELQNKVQQRFAE